VSREEPLGGTPAKYYAYNRESVREKLTGKIDKSHRIDKKTAEKIIITEKNKMVELRGVIGIYIRFWELLEKNIDESPKILE
jgi:AMMECR1 domain-containing protein